MRKRNETRILLRLGLLVVNVKMATINFQEQGTGTRDRNEKCGTGDSIVREIRGVGREGEGDAHTLTILGY